MTGSKDSRRLTPKMIAYIAIMAALGTALAIVTIEFLPSIAPGIDLDFSHVGTFLAAIPGGPIIGLITGAIVGVYPGFAFGFTHGQLGVFGLVALPFGKALTGLFCGIIQRYVKRPLVSVTLSYIPECFFTIWLFVNVMPLFGWPPDAATGFVIALGISVKAWIEILAMAFMMEMVFLSRGVVHLLRNIFPDWDYTPLSEL